MKEKIVISSVAIIEILTIKFWLVCTNMRSMMDMSSVNVKLQLEDYIHNDTETSMTIIRMFHNKVTGFGINLLDKYLKYWDIRFTTNVFSLIGVFGIFLGLWYLGRSKLRFSLKIAIFTLLLLWPLPFALNLPTVPFVAKFLLFGAPYYLLSLFGLWKFMENNKKYGYIIIILISLLSLWWLLILPREIAYFCSK